MEPRAALALGATDDRIRNNTSPGFPMVQRIELRVVPKNSDSDWSSFGDYISDTYDNVSYEYVSDENDDLVYVFYGLDAADLVEWFHESLDDDGAFPGDVKVTIKDLSESEWAVVKRKYDIGEPWKDDESS